MANKIRQITKVHDGKLWHFCCWASKAPRDTWYGAGGEEMR